MYERTFEANMVIAAGLWITAVAIVAVDLLVTHGGLSHVSTLFAMVAATVNVRGFIARHARLMRDAFQYGVDTEHERARAGRLERVR